MTPTPEPGSFRDRNGRIYVKSDTVYRGLSRESLTNWERLASTQFFSRAQRDDRIVQTELVNAIEIADDTLTAPWAGYLKHQKIPFISYPYEWPFEMLKEAAILHLELLDEALNEKMILKDSSSFNVQFRGTRPIFIDVPSFEALTPGEPWVGFRQFCQMFLYPLMIQAYRNVPFRHWLRGGIDGIEPADCLAMMSLRDMLRPGVFTMVYLQSKLLSAYGQSTRKMKDEIADAGFSEELIKVNVTKMKRIVSGLHWHPKTSEWSQYTDTHSYDDESLNEKIDFVRAVVQSRHRDLAWDIGCNTGTFSRILAENTEYVVAMDMDQFVVQKLFKELRTEDRTNILPLVCNLADPSPDLGWRGSERKSLSRRGKPNLTLCLALIHHIVIGANIPLFQFIQWLAELETDLVIEMVTKDDPMVQKLLLNKEDIYDDYERAYLEECLARYFVIERQQEIQSGTRILYYARFAQ